MKNWKSILLYIGVAYIVLLLGPIAGFDLPKIIGEIVRSPEVLIQQLLV
ncbi:MAG: branched-chain amino acid ABC transporter permease, partial [Oscillatoriales cyanobacterium]